MWDLDRPDGKPTRGGRRPGGGNSSMVAGAQGASVPMVAHGNSTAPVPLAASDAVWRPELRSQAFR
eukprot:16450915-Heterocapsa_arctica.AAC.1